MRWTTDDFRVGYSQYYLCDYNVIPESVGLGQAFQGNSLVGAGGGHLAVVCGTHFGRIRITVEVRDDEPAAAFDGWAMAVDVSHHSNTGRTWLGDMDTGGPPELWNLTPGGPGWYRVRVRARGRDAARAAGTACFNADPPIEEHAVSIWPAPPAPEVVHRSEDEIAGGPRPAPGGPLPVFYPECRAGWAPPPASDEPTELVPQRVEKIIDWTIGHYPGAQLVGARLAGRDLTFANFMAARLTGADLTGSILANTKLTATDLAGARLSQANLDGADLANANLTGARLDDAVLTGVHLGEARLAGAVLTRANLHRANLVGADLTGADLTGVRLDGVRWSDSPDWPETTHWPTPALTRHIRAHSDPSPIRPTDLTVRALTL
ncbi:pentapeptide repeat-containing protein [Frankia sp. AgB1.9]|uniref:pentapeptide repeat-containing protein n=1 Tax=unclassified Frankia TaxID=2632575 RepID=UPI0019316EB3|nr:MULTISPECIES: pentapeptide repeat-containing protein [unclassified Frankia]MBL7487492.1 pentapeptide repeat-containing protein [Frankia sp. AgW1.1]MBL7547454.1 pentapeptide repeat-containing protein [Frankia sp. AgB1.9]MBL7618770.1 pentapeptide repeat-containing protein [Frankia sp. AgB1.8]